VSRADYHHIELLGKRHPFHFMDSSSTLLAAGRPIHGSLVAMKGVPPIAR
jgi:hypothetical protein